LRTCSMPSTRSWYAATRTVFGEESAGAADEVLSIWGRVKNAEPKAERKRTTGLLGGVPRALPALMEAQQIASKAAGVGFDWENAEQRSEEHTSELQSL